MTTEVRFHLIASLRSKLNSVSKKLDICQRAFYWALAMWTRDSNTGNLFSPFRAKTNAWSAKIDTLTAIYTLYSEELLKLYRWED
nr:MAG TPA: hypothetical protein [Caudoviricetes sp.]